MDAPTIWRFDCAGNALGQLTGIVEESRVEEVNGEDSLSVTCACEVEKYDTLVMCDRHGRWHEWRVEGVSLGRRSGVPVRTASCEASLQETAGDYIEDRRPGVQKPVGCGECLEAALGPTRWEVGAVEVGGTGGVSMYHTSALAAVRAVVEEFGGELRQTIEVDGPRVSARKVDVLERLGSASTGKRFEYRKDVSDISRSVDSSEVCTAAWGWGKGEQTDSGGYGRRIGFADINGGVGYVADEAARKAWGRPDGSGGTAHRFGQYVSEQQTDPAALMAETRAWLDENKTPKVSYTLSVVDLSAYGMAWEGTALGDDVAIVDDELGVEATGRVLRIEWHDMAPEDTKVTIGNVSEDIASMLARQESAWQQVQDSMGAWNEAASASKPFLDLLRAGLNAQFAEAGSYVYQSAQDGYITSSVPLDAEMRPTQTPFWMVQMARGMLRLANRVDGSGEPVWTTWVTGEGLVADVINAGVIRGGANSWNLETGELTFEQGVIRTADGSVRIDLNSGEVSFAASTTIGGQTVEQIAQTKVSVAAEGIAAEVSKATEKRLEGYYTKEQADAAIKVAADGVSASVTSATEKRLGDYYTKQQADAAIKVAADEVGASVRRETQETLGGYYTKQQADAAIKVAADGISSEVSKVEERVGAISVGGRNLLLGTATFGGDVPSPWSIAGGELCCTDETGEVVPMSAGEHGLSAAAGGKLTVSYEYLVSSVLDVGSAGPRVGAELIASYSDGTPSAILDASFSPGAVELGRWLRFRATFDVPEGQLSSLSLRACHRDVTGEVRLRKFKAEVGTMATDWAPAPEDVEADISGVEQAVGATIREMSTRVDQTSESVTTTITRVERAVEDIGTIQDGLEGATGRLDTIEAYYRAEMDEDGNIVLKLVTSASDMNVELSNAQLSFKDGEVTVAYINGQKLYITQAQVLSQLVIGNYAWVPRSDGHMSLKYIG